MAATDIVAVDPRHRVRRDVQNMLEGILNVLDGRGHGKIKVQALVQVGDQHSAVLQSTILIFLPPDPRPARRRFY
jgi:hypothetical protein